MPRYRLYLHTYIYIYIYIHCIHFSKEEVSFLIKEALQNDLIVIPLVQTFGHLEVKRVLLLAE